MMRYIYGYGSSSNDETLVNSDVEVVDGDGDVLMTDLQDIWVGGLGSGSGSGYNEQEGAYASLRRGTRFIEGWGVGVGDTKDFLEELTGVSRMDIEIH